MPEETRLKISQAKKGKHLSEINRSNISIAKGGNGKLDNRYPPGHQTWAKAIKQRDGECVHCHSKEQLEAHHLLRRSKFPQFATELWNGLTLCAPCHTITHSKVGI